MDAAETGMTVPPPSSGAQGTTASESKGDPMLVKEQGHKTKSKTTYYARKDEIQMLQAEVAALAKHKELLHQKKRLLAAFGAMDEDNVQNVLLRESLKRADLMLVGVHSLLANYKASHSRNPLKVSISLPIDPIHRNLTLASMRDERVREARTFILKRIRYLDLRLPHRESESFGIPNGDHFLLQWDVEPCATTESVKNVFDDTIKVVKEQEFTIWERLGITTTYESDDAENYSYSQSRGFSTAPDGAEVEKNVASFLMFSEGDEQLDCPHGFVVMHPVTEDELYPFQLHLRVRHDVTMVLMVCPRPGGGGVVIVRWAYLRTPKPQCGISHHQELRIRDVTARWSEIERNNLLESVFKTY